jgi:deoxyribose-phosphate aldolase
MKQKYDLESIDAIAKDLIVKYEDNSYKARIIPFVLEYCIVDLFGNSDDFLKKCNQAKKLNLKSMCISPNFLKEVVKGLEGSNVKTTCVISFPDGKKSLKEKVSQIKNAIREGVNYLDIYIDPNLILSGKYKKAISELKTLKKAAEGEADFRITIDTSVLTSDLQKIKLILISILADINEIKVAAGESKEYVSVEDIKLVRYIVGKNRKIKADGGIRTIDKAIELLEAGANYLGSSSLADHLEKERDEL